MMAMMILRMMMMILVITFPGCYDTIRDIGDGDGGVGNHAVSAGRSADSSS